MTGNRRQSGFWIMSGLVCTIVAAGANCVAAQALSESEALIRKLECRSGQDCDNRNLSGAPRRTKRGLGSQSPGTKRSFEFVREEERKEIEDRAKEGMLPSADIEIYFAYDSSEILQPASKTLSDLGQALLDPRLSGSRFLLIGHTDAKGSASYNQALSERRAQAARDYLLYSFAIEPDRLQAYGRGESSLKTPKRPAAAVNRRVQIINVGASAHNTQ